ncbi:MAG: hypothetical protein H0U73_10630 [Tatlockia sp.]|nr:hypothetical protein [Tatlockia sp.]
MTKRVVVYGQDTKEKTQLMDQFKTSTQLEFLSSTPPNRFRIVNDGRKPPVNLASLQVLFLNLENETMESISSLERNYRLCDFTRPLMFILKGTENSELMTKLASYLVKDNIVIQSINKIEELKVEDLANELKSLGNDYFDNNPTINISM